MNSTRFCLLCGADNETTNSLCCVCQHPLLPETGQSNPSGNTLLHDRYHILTTLGTGGFSSVYQARDTQTDQTVAIKQIHLRTLNVEEIIDATETFNREVSVLSTLNHPQVPHLYAHFQDRDHWYLVLEYFAGSTLETIIEQRLAQGNPFQFAEVLTSGTQLCTVLDYLHTRQPPIIFRDLKPGNIIQGPTGQLSLIDFGIARNFRRGQSRDTQLLGSPGYAAPEQYGLAQTSPQSDMYSLGVLLYALLAGSDPTTHTPDLDTLGLTLRPGGLAMHALLARMLSIDPGDRPGNMREVASALDAIKQRPQAADNDARIELSAMPSVVQQQIFSQPQPAQLTPPIHKVHRREVVIGLGSLVASIGAGISWKTLISHSPSATSDNSFPTSMYTSIPARTYIKHSTPINGVAWSNDSLFIASCSEHMLRVWRVSNGQNVFTYNSRGENNLNGFALSPDGAFLAVASDTEGVIVLNAGDGIPSASYRQHPAFVNAVCWSPDSTRIASANNDKTVQIWDAASGKNLAIYSGHQTSVKAVAWSPNGLYIASASADGIVRTWDTGTGAMYINFNWNYGRSINAVAWSPDSLYVAEASEDTTVRLLKNSWHGSLPFTYTGHAASVTAVSWSPDGKRIASADVNGKILLCDAFSGEHTLSYGNSLLGIYALAWSPNGQFLATGSEDHTVKIWQVVNK